MKLLLIILLISVIMLIAWSVSEQYKDKFDFYLNLKQFLEQFRINLSFKQEKISNFISNFKPKKHFKLFLNCYQEYLNTGEFKIDEIKILDFEEKKDLVDIVKNLGNLDVCTELKQLDTYILQINEKFKKCEADKNKICPMILKLSLLFAVGLSILLI